MKRISNKKLKSMSPEEQEKYMKDCLDEFNKLGEQLREITQKKVDSEKTIGGNDASDSLS